MSVWTQPGPAAHPPRVPAQTSASKTRRRRARRREQRQTETPQQLHCFIKLVHHAQADYRCSPYGNHAKRAARRAEHLLETRMEEDMRFRSEETLAQQGHGLEIECHEPSRSQYLTFRGNLDLCELRELAEGRSTECPETARIFADLTAQMRPVLSVIAAAWHDQDIETGSERGEPILSDEMWEAIGLRPGGWEQIGGVTAQEMLGNIEALAPLLELLSPAIETQRARLDERFVISGRHYETSAEIRDDVGTQWCLWNLCSRMLTEALRDLARLTWNQLEAEREYYGTPEVQCHDTLIVDHDGDTVSPEPGWPRKARRRYARLALLQARAVAAWELEQHEKAEKNAVFWANAQQQTAAQPTTQGPEQAEVPAQERHGGTREAVT